MQKKKKKAGLLVLGINEVLFAFIFMGFGLFLLVRNICLLLY